MYDFDCTYPILLTGCGGGYDMFTGLPIYLSLLGKYSSIYLGNFSFTGTDLLKGCDKISEHAHLVKPGHPVPPNVYFPEQLLANQLGVPIIAFEYINGVVTLEKSYRDVIELYKIKTVILCDGGCDSILFGSERHLATPVEDMMNIYVINKLLSESVIEIAYLSVLGITADYFEGVNPEDVRLNIDYLTNKGGLVHKYRLNNKCDISNEYIKIFLQCDPCKSIVNCCIVEAIKGNFGNVVSEYLISRLKSRKIFVSPLTSTHYVFKLKIVAESIQYLNLLQEIDNSDEIDEIITRWNDDHIEKSENFSKFP